MLQRVPRIEAHGKFGTKDSETKEVASKVFNTISEDQEETHKPGFEKVFDGGQLPN